MDTLLGLLAVLLLVLANGFFVAAEFSLVAIRRSRIEQLVAEGNPFAPAVQRGAQHLDSFLAACQLGITLSSLGLGWIGEPALAGLIEPALHSLPPEWAAVSAHSIAIFVAFSIITTLHIVVGELAPKSLALQRTEGTALAVAAPLGIFLTVFRPIIFLMNGMGNMVLRLLGLRPASGEEQVHSVEELRYLVSASRDAGVLDEVESQMLGRIFNFGETRAYEVMAPRTEISALEANSSLEQALEQMAQGPHARLPVYETDIDDIVGVLHLRDVVRALRQGTDPRTPVQTVARSPLLLPEGTSIETVLSEMRRNRSHMAILIDEHGGVAGLVTMEDLLEQIVGDVQDEFEPPHEAFRLQPDGSATIDGLLSVKEFGEHFHIELTSEDYSTVGGLVMAKLDRMPQLGDRVAVNGYQLEVTEMDGLRVAEVKVSKT